MVANPRVSVLMPIYDPREDYLRIAIDSVRAQTIDDWELVIVEDPPASRAAEVIASYGDARIRHHVRARRSALADALNDGLAICRGNLIARFDSDDICRRDRLELQLAHFHAHPDTIAVGTSLAIVDESGKVIGHRRLPTDAGDVAKTLRRYNCIAHPSVMFRRDVVIASGGYASGWSPEDYDLWCRLSKSGARLENLGDELVLYRFHEAALKFSDVHGNIRRTIETKRRHFAGQLSLRDRLRIAAERALLLLPAPVVLRLFRMLTYGSTP